MAAPPAYSNSGDDTGAEPDPEATGTPRWVKVFGIIALVLVVLVVLMLVVGRGNHGPRRHAGGSQIVLSDGIEAAGAAGHTGPAGGRTSR